MICNRAGRGTGLSEHKIDLCRDLRADRQTRPLLVAPREGRRAGQTRPLFDFQAMLCTTWAPRLEPGRVETVSKAPFFIHLRKCIKEHILGGTGG